jgi:3-deoxy-7-phosphoheptulonate synthase
MTLIDRNGKKEKKTVDIMINGKKVGEDLLVIAGPCSVEDHETMRSIVRQLKELGVDMLRAGAFKPRTSPYTFQGLKTEGLDIIRALKEEFSIPVSTEILDVRDIEKAYDILDVVQIGSRNMYNYVLLEEVAKMGKPVILKRGFSATVEEWLGSAEYILKEGNGQVILCERGIRTFETTTRNTLDLNSVAYLAENSDLPVIVDPSHGTGLRELVYPMSLAAIAAGASGLIIEAHTDPDNALSDCRQTIDMETLKKTIDASRKLWRM